MSSTPLPKFSLIKRDAHVIFSTIKPPVKIKLWNMQTFEHFQRHLIRWLEGDIPEGEQIRKIQRQIIVRNKNRITNSWKTVRNDVDLLMMMIGPDDIMLIVCVIR